jgi:hypothetical protein
MHSAGVIDCVDNSHSVMAFGRKWLQLNCPLRRGSHLHRPILPRSDRPARTECIGGREARISGRKCGIFVYGLLIYFQIRIGYLPASVVGSSRMAVKIISSGCPPARHPPPAGNGHKQGYGDSSNPYPSDPSAPHVSSSNRRTGAKHRDVAALRQFDQERVGFAVTQVVFIQARPKPPRFSPDNRITLRVVIRGTPEYLDGQHGFFKVRIPALQAALDYESEKPAEAIVSSKSGTLQDTAQLSPDGFCLRLLG